MTASKTKTAPARPALPTDLAGWHWEQDSHGSVRLRASADDWATQWFETPGRAIAQARRRVLSQPKEKPAPTPAPIWCETWDRAATDLDDALMARLEAAGWRWEKAKHARNGWHHEVSQRGDLRSRRLLLRYRLEALVEAVPVPIVAVEAAAPVLPPGALSESLQDCARRALAADRKGGEALLEKATAIADARKAAQHGDWLTFLAAIRLDERAARRLCAIHERAASDERFADAVRRGWLTFSVAAIAAQADEQLLEALLVQEAPPTVREAQALANPNPATLPDLPIALPATASSSAAVEHRDAGLPMLVGPLAVPDHNLIASAITALEAHGYTFVRRRERWPEDLCYWTFLHNGTEIELERAELSRLLRRWEQEAAPALPVEPARPPLAEITAAQRRARAVGYELSVRDDGILLLATGVKRDLATWPETLAVLAELEQAGPAPEPSIDDQITRISAHGWDLLKRYTRGSGNWPYFQFRNAGSAEDEYADLSEGELSIWLADLDRAAAHRATQRAAVASQSVPISPPVLIAPPRSLSDSVAIYEARIANGTADLIDDRAALYNLYDELEERVEELDTEIYDDIAHRITQALIALEQQEAAAVPDRATIRAFLDTQQAAMAARPTAMVFIDDHRLALQYIGVLLGEAALAEAQP
jgi:hypothetical protein